MFAFITRRREEKARFLRVCIASVARYNELLNTEETQFEFMNLESPLNLKQAEWIGISVPEFNWNDAVGMNKITGLGIRSRDDLRNQKLRLMDYIAKHA